MLEAKFRDDPLHENVFTYLAIFILFLVKIPEMLILSFKMLRVFHILKM